MKANIYERDVNVGRQSVIIEAKAKDISKLKNVRLTEFRLFDGHRYTNYIYVKAMV